MPTDSLSKTAPGQEVGPDTPVTLFSMPSVYATGLQVSQAQNDFSLVFTKLISGQAMVDGKAVTVAKSEPVVELQLSAKTMKDLLVVVQNSMAQYEAEWGAVETEFTRKRATGESR